MIPTNTEGFTSLKASLPETAKVPVSLAVVYPEKASLIGYVTITCLHALAHTYKHVPSLLNI